MYYKQSYRIGVFTFIVVALILTILFIINNNSGEVSQYPNLFEQADSISTDDNSYNKIQEPAGESTPPIQQKTFVSSLDDSYMEKLQEENINREAQRLKAMEKVPVLGWRNELLANIKSEDIKQTIENIPNFDDSVLAASSSPEPLLRRSARNQNQYVVNLMRVRKLYAIGQENPNLLIPELRHIQRNSLNDWPDVFRKWLEAINKGDRRHSEPDAYMRASDYCLAATYLLAELGDYNSLPTLLQQYKIHHIWPPPNILPAPVPPAITFYAMHRLTSSYPRDSLSKEAAQALDEYLETAEEFVPAPEQIKVTVWDAAYSESDPRLAMLNLKGEILEGQKSMTMPLYPVKFLDGSEMQDDNGVKSKKLDELFNKLDAFVQIIYPSTNSEF